MLLSQFKCETAYHTFTHLQNRDAPLSLGLTNLCDRAWWVTDIQGDIKMVEPESTLTLTLGTQIEFGELEGEIV